MILYGITADSGNVYITGSILGSTALDTKAVTAQDMFIIKFNSSGTRQWTVVNGPPTGFTYAQGNGIAVDASGNVYVGGKTAYGPMDGLTLVGTVDLFLTKYNSSGVRQWTVDKGGAPGNSGMAGVYSLTLDASANIYFSGYTNLLPIDGQPMRGLTDIVVSKYDTAGAFQWTVENGSSTAPGSLKVRAMTTDAAGNTIVFGNTDVGINGQSLNGVTDYFLTKYDSNGTRQWTVLNGTVGGGASAEGIITDASNNIFIVGTIEGTAIDSQARVGVRDYFLSKYNSSGVRQWTIEKGVANTQFSVNGVAVDSAGNIYTVGSNFGAAIDGQTLKGTQDLIITKFNSSGTRIWTVEAGVTGGKLTPGKSIVIDSSDNIYIAGETNAGFDSQTLKGIKDYYITKYTTAGARVWTIQNGVASATVSNPRLALDSAGNIFVVGNTDRGLDGQILKGVNDYFISKYDASGTRLWTKQSGASGGTTYVGDIKISSTGKIYVAGQTNRGIDGQSLRGTVDFFVANYNTSGTRQWTVEERMATTINGLLDGARLSLGTADRFFLGCGVEFSKDGAAVRGLVDLYVTKY
jgi:hypothetical protein